MSSKTVNHSYPQPVSASQPSATNHPPEASAGNTSLALPPVTQWSLAATHLYPTHIFKQKLNKVQPNGHKSLPGPLISLPNTWNKPCHFWAGPKNLLPAPHMLPAGLRGPVSTAPVPGRLRADLPPLSPSAPSAPFLSQMLQLFLLHNLPKPLFPAVASDASWLGPAFHFSSERNTVSALRLYRLPSTIFSLRWRYLPKWGGSLENKTTKKKPTHIVAFFFVFLELLKTRAPESNSSAQERQDGQRSNALPLTFSMQFTT